MVSKTAVMNPYLIEIFQPAITFVKEIRFYSDIIPAVQEFEILSNVPSEKRLDAFITHIGSRISLKSGMKIELFYFVEVSLFSKLIY